ncbi:hypothetical protein NPIL_290621 [Nephila pilipes]|uniref:Uncharacterized protein n=1 Tax=Nephila pilipes TaxID=299642 RepID=A0A8X6UNN1_NEPPI|nr:hypothetical protein NPIL_290621 [Nephila pilipes]
MRDMFSNPINGTVSKVSLALSWKPLAQARIYGKERGILESKPWSSFYPDERKMGKGENYDMVAVENREGTAKVTVYSSKSSWGETLDSSESPPSCAAICYKDLEASENCNYMSVKFLVKFNKY